MDLSDYRQKESEKERVSNLINLLPQNLESVLDIGARDGFISKELTKYSHRVIALDLEVPSFSHERVECVKGDATALQFQDKSVDLVFCAEVLEHIPTTLLPKACREIGRVAREYVLVGVPYKQDIRYGRTNCSTCGKTNPPWGHVNTFDEGRLKQLFPDFDIARISYVGHADIGMNFISSFLLNMAGNPFGTYDQDEPCIHCGSQLKNPPQRKLWQKLATRAAYYTRDLQSLFQGKHANWIHILFKKLNYNAP
jgi:SAM-dependent methyltransferase